MIQRHRWLRVLTLVFFTAMAWQVTARANHLCQVPPNLPPGCGALGHEPEPESEPEPQFEPDACSGPFGILQDRFPDRVNPESGCRETPDKPSIGEDVSSDSLLDPADPELSFEPICDTTVACEDGVPHFDLETSIDPLTEAERRTLGVAESDVVVSGGAAEAARDAIQFILQDTFDHDGDGRFGSTERASMSCDASGRGPTGMEVLESDPTFSCGILESLRLRIEGPPATDESYCIAIHVFDTRPGTAPSERIGEVLRLWWCFAFTPEGDAIPSRMPSGVPAPDLGNTAGDSPPTPLVFMLPATGANGSPLDVVINELGWMGTSADPQDQFIELFNNTEQAINLSGWRLISSVGNPDIPLSGIILPRGYFILERPDDGVLADIHADLDYSDLFDPGGEALQLLDPSGNPIDEVNADGGPWPAGYRVGEAIACMERINPALAGFDENWGNNDRVTRNGVDANGHPLNCTPGALNSATSSEGATIFDPTAPRTPAQLAAFPVVRPATPAPETHSLVGRTITVDDDGEADFSILAEAVAVAHSGDVILVAPGTYRGQLLVKRRNISIIGAGAGQTVIEHTDVAVIFAGTRSGRLAGFTVRYVGSNPHAALVVFSANVTLEDNVIMGATRSGVDVQGEGSEALLRGNQIHNNTHSGVLVHQGATVTLKGNAIFDNGVDGQAGVEVTGTSTATLSDNLIEINGGSGVYAHDDAVVWLENNQILRNRLHGVSISGEATVTLRDNSMLFNAQLGLRLRSETAQGVARGNFIAGNVIGLLTEGVSITAEKNILFANEVQVVGMGVSGQDAALNFGLLFRPDFLNFSNGLERLRLIQNRLDSSRLILEQPQSVEALQAVNLVLGHLYRGEGIRAHASARFLIVIQLHAANGFAREAQNQLIELGQ